MSKSPIIPGSFHATVSVTNGGSLLLWRNLNSIYPRFVFQYDANGDIVAIKYDETDGNELERFVVGNIGELPLNSTVISRVDGCRNIISFYNESMQKLGQFEDDEVLFLNYIQASTYENSENSISYVLLPSSLVCSSVSSGSPNLLSLTEGEPIPWWM